jgi:hypothetical protein
MHDDKETHTPPAPRLSLSEDWLAVLLAFGLIILSVLGILGKNGLEIPF